MTFSCSNYEFGTDTCAKLKTDCIPGRPGCVLEGKVKLSEVLEKRLSELAEERKQIMRRNR
jgi:tryptophanyl-tRNA synthetase